MERWVRLFRWLWATPWPVYALTMVQANIIGAVFVFAFLRFVLPMDRFLDLEQFRFLNQYLFIGYLVLAFVGGVIASTLLLLPVLRVDRSGEEFGGAIRNRALKLPFHQALISGTMWLVGTIVFVVANVGHSPRLALVVGVTSILGGTTTCLISYLQAERIMRPITVRALARGVPANRHVPGVRRRIFLGWALTTVIPVAGILLILTGQWVGLFGDEPEHILVALAVMASVAVIAGAIGMGLVSDSIADPVREMQAGVGRVKKGDLEARVTIYDSSEIGRLGQGFNEMVTGLQEREAIQDLFGRYVGEEVARHALERGTELGGQEKQVAVLFVDLTGSTEFAAAHEPAEVVAVLNEFFRIAVEAVDSNGGYINKFQGDALLAVFGAPLEVENEAGRALRAARALQSQLAGLSPLSAGIGVSYGTVIAGHIGHAKRFEYTVIGDPVNEAARLTTLAKSEQGHVLASAAAIRNADAPEAARWVLGRSVELRGRGIMTQLARPLRPTLADRWQSGKVALRPTVEGVEAAGA
ncbi:adenylate/guanylate cyclase domain-containing protein [Dietzia natronolimnaea]|uniref:Adenylate/guanylate cyclase domain-containing protein n=1 Tax=Dietzia natronolimnaea TaxID=161920 RepID=A0A2A2WR37_9ACTN|nr:adenylate/guanylate cyclase domain-containing protein [Dietzia natronolimnaea]PAY23493.1 adenylate/guanylate cyclase domain-containing protein [Dietzia natronolimnaea]